MVFFLENKPGVLFLFLLGYFCNKETAIRGERGMHCCLPPAANTVLGHPCCAMREGDAAAPTTLLHMDRTWIPSLGVYLPALALLLGCTGGKSPGAFAKAEQCDKAKATGQRSVKGPSKEGLVRRSSEQRGASEISPKAGASPPCYRVREANQLVSNTACGEQV